ncbi:Protein kinase domain [Pelomyxa schiedti]|nr:Protein kinase domain [Pelomyxa schiedti]
MGVCVDEKAKEFSIVFDRMECSLTALLEKQDLPTKMRKYIKLTYEQKLDIFLQMLTVIEFLHNTAHMVHCDIKLDNFLLDANLKLKLCDLGFAKLIWESKPIASGTQLYMAPELWKQKGYGPSSPASDIYALSFTMYQLLYEWPLFEADVTATEDSFVNSVVLGLVRPNLSKQPKDPDIKIPLQPCLVKMFTRCWHPDPSSRLTATEALALVNEAITLYQTRSQGLLSYLAYKFHY